MLKKLSRGMSHKAGAKTALKFRFDVQIDKLENLPGPVKKCRVVWSRGPKLQMTDIKAVNQGQRKHAWEPLLIVHVRLMTKAVCLIRRHSAVQANAQPNGNLV